MGPDCTVGDVMEVHVRSGADSQAGQGLGTRAWLVNRFGTTVGYLDADMTEQVQLAEARGMQVHAILAAAYLAVGSDQGYWGETVLMCFTPNTAFENFLQTVSHALSEGIRPSVDLGKSGIAKVKETEGAWLPETRVPAIKPPEGSALLKDHASVNDKLIEAARQRNPGCMFAGYAFIAVLVVLVAWVIWGIVT